MYQVIEIIEPDFGCEGVPDGQEVCCDVILQDEHHNRKTVTIPDAELYQKEIYEGVMVTFKDDKIQKV